MTRTPEQQKRFERMAVVLANETYIRANSYAQIPEKLRDFYEMLEYKELIRPLVYRDRIEKEWPEQKIANCYCITRQEVRTILKKGKNLVARQPGNGL